MSRVPRGLRCRRLACEAQATEAGYCEDHYQAEQEERRRREDGLQLVHNWTVDRSRVRSPQVLAALEKLAPHWRNACWAAQSNQSRDEFGAEPTHAVEWCISAGSTLARIERAFRDDSPEDDRILEIDWVWRNFSDLEERRNTKRAEPPASVRAKGS